jgi:hypothetical protein
VAAGEAAPAPSAVLPTAAARDLPTQPDAPLVRPGTGTGPTHPLAPPSPPPPGGGRSVVLVAAGTAVLLAAGAVVAVLALSGGDEQPAERERAVRTTIETVTAPAAAPAEPGPPVTRSEVESRLNTYATLYTAEGAGQIAGMLAPDVVRRNGSDPPQDRDEAIAEYERQFRTLVKPVYTIDIESIDVGDGEAAAEARYLIDADNAPTASGAIHFHLVRSEFDLLIDEIRIQPD